MLRATSLFLATSLALSAASAADAPTRHPAKLAVLEFGILDTSGEARHQQAAHATRLRAMRDQIRASLARSGDFSLADLEGRPYALATDLDQALNAARAAGADYVLLGVVQKMSTLVLWCRASVVDLATGKTVLDRWLSFRGDSNQAWYPAATFLAGEIEAHPPGS